MTDTPTERVAHGSQRAFLRQCPTPLDPGRNDFSTRVFRAGSSATFSRVMASTPRHTFQILTKRSRRLRHLAGELTWPPNLWMGVSVETPEQLCRITDLCAVPAAVRFLSCEPLLAALTGLDLAGIGWVIAGGESGRGYRPVAVEWVRQLRDECRRQGVPFFFKQWGGPTPKSGGRILDGRTWGEMPNALSS